MFGLMTYNDFLEWFDICFAQIDFRDKEITELKQMIQEICPHKKVRGAKNIEMRDVGLFIPEYVCVVCGKKFSSKPKNSKLVKFKCEWEEVE